MDAARVPLIGQDDAQEHPGVDNARMRRLRRRQLRRYLRSPLFNQDAVDVVNAIDVANPVPYRMGHEIKHLKHMGPAVAWAILQNAVTWLTFMLCPMILSLTDKTQTTSHYRWFCVVYVIASLILKALVARYTLPCFLSVCGRTSIYDWDIPWLYALKMAFLSCVSSTDILTNTVFVTEMSSSSKCVWILWGLMLLQPIYVIAMVTPKQDWKVTNRTGGVFPKDYGIPKCDVQTSVYRTYLEETQTHMGALFVLGHGGRIKSLTMHSQSYLCEFHSTRQSCTAATKILKQQMYHSLLFTITENVLFLTAKGEVALTSCDDGSCNRVAILGAVLGSLTGLLAVYQDTACMWSLYGDVLQGHWHFWTVLNDVERRERGLEPEKTSLKDASWYLVVQVLASGVCVVALTQLPFRLLLRAAYTMWAE